MKIINKMYQEGKTINFIAQFLGVSFGAIKRRINRELKI